MNQKLKANEMQINFVKKLIDNGVICTGTELSGLCKRPDLAGLERVTSGAVYKYHSYSEDSTGNIVFNVIDLSTGAPKKLSISDIGTIDGMSADRLGQVYSIASDGSLRPEPVRRGRKPRIKIEDRH